MSQHDLRLDGLRGLAVSLVLLFHARMLPWGGEGVDVFFVLSGWLITGILQREIERTGGINVASFMARRARRLLPALGLVLAAYAVLCPFIWPYRAKTVWLDAGGAGLFVSDWRDMLWKADGPLTHTWSLAVEMQFYIIWPVVLLALRPLGRLKSALVLSGLWALITAVRTWFLWQGNDPVAYYLMPTHSSGLVLGSILALAPLKAPRWISVLGLSVIGVVALVPNVHETYFYRPILTEFGSAAVLMAPPARLAWRPLAWVGRISYGVYLWHMPVFQAIWEWPFMLRTVVGFAATILVAAASFYFLERRFLSPTRPLEPRVVDRLKLHDRTVG